MRNIEQAMPEMRAVTGNVQKAMFAVVAMVCAAAAKLTFGW
jgi:hypothetical protein